MIILLSIIGLIFTVNSKLLIYSGQNNFDWVSNQLMELPFPGYFEYPGLKLNAIVQRLFQFPPHKQIFIEIIIIQTETFTLVVQIDNEEQLHQTQNYDLNQQIQINFSFHHLNNMGIITIKSSGTTSNTFRWDIQQIQIYIEECPITCKFCPDIYGMDACQKIQPLYFSHMGPQAKDQDQKNWQTDQGHSLTYNFFGFRYFFFNLASSYKLQRNFEVPQNNGLVIKFNIFFFQNLPNSIKVFINNQVYDQNMNQFTKIPLITYNYISYPDYNQFFYSYQISISNKDNNIYQNKIQIQITSSNQIILSIQDFNIYYEKMDPYWLQELQGCQTILYNKCMECQEGWFFRNDEPYCIPICGDMIIQSLEECDDGNDEPFDGCLDCKFQCSLKCKICEFGQCIEYKKIQELIQIKQDCSEIGFISQRGYYYDLQWNDCKPICGDGIITIDEDCEDLNDTEFDGCFNCKYSCVMNCFKCKYGKCIYCNIGYILQEDRCQPYCGDSRALDQETCDDGNDLQFDGCYNCQNSCQIECTICLNAICYECLNGWTLEQGICQQLCGDNQIALTSNELCDDLTNIYCIDCLFQCSQNCLKCDQPLQCNLCETTYTLINGKCISICGDKQITPYYEQCDDGNDIPFDGCHYCQFQCSYGCLICEQNNQCKECDSINFYYLDSLTFLCQKLDEIIIEDLEIPQLIDKLICNNNFIYINDKCETLCGNGKLASLYEQCDDGNQNSGDGCSSQCKFEESFICLNQENSISICTFVVLPDFKLNSQSQKTDQIQIIQLIFTEKVKLIQDNILEDYCKIQITPNTAQYEMNIIPIMNLTTILTNPLYQFKILFKQPVQSPIFTITIAEQQIYNNDGIQLKQLEKQISLGDPFILSQQNKEYLTSIVKMNDAMMYCMIATSGFALITGNSATLINLIDLLQQLSYIRFMQYNFPPHLRQYLESFTKISLKPILDYLKLDELLTILNNGKLPFQTKNSQSINQSQTINQFYLINAKSCYLSLFTSLLSYILCSIITQINTSYYFSKIIQLKSMKFYKLKKLFQILQNLKIKCLKFKNQYFFSGLFQVYYTIMHQFLFSAFMQFPNYNFTSLFEIFNSINAIFALGFIIFIQFQQFMITTRSIKNKKDWTFFFNGIEQNFWCQIYKPIQMLKITSYIFVIVFLMDYPEAQSFILSLQSSFYFVYLIIKKPIKFGFESLKLILREILFSLTICSFYVYSYHLFDHEKLLISGWIHIFMFSSILGSNLILDIGKYIKETYDTIQKRKQKRNRELNYQYQNNHLHQFIMIEHQQMLQQQLQYKM